MARNSCAPCTIGCEHIYAARAADVRLEYETLFALGPLCGVATADVVLGGSARLCDELGWTRSRPAARSPSRWSAPSAGSST